MPPRDFRSVEYCRLKKDFTWDTQQILVPYEFSYHEAISYIWQELNYMNMTDDLSNISILNFPEETITVTG